MFEESGSQSIRWGRWLAVLFLASLLLAMSNTNTVLAQVTTPTPTTVPEEEESTEEELFQQPEPLRLVLILQANPETDAQAALMLAGAKAAADDNLAIILPRFPNRQFTAGELIVDAVRTSPDGVVIAIADPDIVASALGVAAKSSVYIATIGNGADYVRTTGILIHAGVDEEVIGQRVGSRASERGAVRSLCIARDWQHPLQVARCQGFADGLNHPINILDVGETSVAAYDRIKVTLSLEEPFDAIYLAHSDVLLPFMRVLREREMPSDKETFVVAHGTSKQGARAITEELIDEMVDPQPFLQSYIATTSLVMRNQFRLRARGGFVTGPVFIDAKELGEIEKLLGVAR